MVLQTDLGQTGLKVSEIGYGCVALTTIARESDAMNLLSEAFDLGITHFDTARAYGAGFSETLLGRFIRGRRDRVTIATKFGLVPPPLVVGNQRFVATVKRALKVVPLADRLVRRRLAAQSDAHGPEYSPAACRASLEKSLGQLGCDHVDLYFLHNAEGSDALNEDLIATARDLIDEGKIRAFGMSSGIEKIGEDLDRYPPVYSVFQGDHGVIGGSAWRNRGSRGIIAFAAQNSLGTIADAIAARPSDARRWSDSIGQDVTDVQTVARLLTQAALDHDGGDAILVGTRNPSHLRTAADAAKRSASAEAMAAFRGMCAEILSPPQP